MIEKLIECCLNEENLFDNKEFHIKNKWIRDKLGETNEGRTERVTKKAPNVNNAIREKTRHPL